MSGSMVSFSGNGEIFEGYFAPAKNGMGPGIIVLQEWWGLVGHIKEVVDRFSAEGFSALAPDLYRGRSTSEPDEAGSLMQALNIHETEKCLAGAIDFLLHSNTSTGSNVGIVGFCMGGQLSMYAATINHKIGACVNYYGIHPNVKPDFSKLTAPLLGFFAENDAFASPEAVAGLSEKLDRLGKRHEFITYPGTHHAFFNNERPQVYSAVAAADSWKRMMAFFRENVS